MRALVMRDGRRASPAAPPGADDPASERSWWVERMLKGLNRCDTGLDSAGSGERSSSGALSLSGCGGGELRAAAHDAGRARVRGREVDEPVE